MRDFIDKHLPIRMVVAAVALCPCSALVRAESTDGGASFAGSVVSVSDIETMLRNASLTREFYGEEARD